MLAEKLMRLAPTLAQSGVRRGWGCLRTFARDRAMVCGADPRVAGLHWIAGLGGHGMTGGVALGELLAQAMDGRFSELARALAPRLGRTPG
jgi:glycine/D-amino acid oxidase-like deaminating enzyme